MVDAEVADINAHNECESLEDITVFEVVTNFQATPKIPASNYPHIFLQLFEGQIIYAENGEVIINLSQFLAPNEGREPAEIETNSNLSSQLSPRPLQIDSEYITSTLEDNEIFGTF